MKIKQIEHYDDFDDTIIFYLEVKEVDNKYKKLAKRIDNENYSDDCFGICLNYSEIGIEIVSDESEDEQLYYVDNIGDKQLYYVDNNGDRHWFKYIIDRNLLNEAIKICINKINI